MLGDTPCSRFWLGSKFFCSAAQRVAASGGLCGPLRPLRFLFTRIQLWAWLQDGPSLRAPLPHSPKDCKIAGVAGFQRRLFMADSLIITGVALFFVIATLYSSIGHAGASGYLAVMALLSFAPESIKPTSLVLNIVVALIASLQFIRAGRFDRKIFFAFIVSSLPMAFVGGYLSLEPDYFKLMAGIFLMLSAVMLLVREFARPAGVRGVRPMPLGVGLVLGAVIGLLSGLIGVGGGIFLSWWAMSPPSIRSTRRSFTGCQPLCLEAHWVLIWAPRSSIRASSSSAYLWSCSRQAPSLSGSIS
jgi:hypothetical protein